MSLAALHSDHKLDVSSQPGRAPLQKNFQPCLVAIDLGAESCRVSLLTWSDGCPNIRLVHRFANAPVTDGSSLRWDLHRICDGINEGLLACAEQVPQGIAAIGVDGWAVDYVRLDSAGHPIASPFCYRDERTAAAVKEVLARISPEDLYEFTGVQLLPLNTLYQLYADKATNLPACASWVNLPEYILHYLGAERLAEYTNATHTQMLRVDRRIWCEEIFSAAGLDLRAAPPIVASGTVVGHVGGGFASLPAFRETKLIAPACHDTASAIAGIPAQGNDSAFISSGTWSLVGCVLDKPCLSAQARKSNFSNEGGIGGKINFLKNVNGMWLLQQCIQHWAGQGDTWTLEGLIQQCSSLRRPSCLIDVDDPALLLPGDMPSRINAQLVRVGHPPISETPAMANVIFYSLAARYASLLQDLSAITGRQLRRLFIVGGGNQNVFLNRLTEEATGLKVILGPTESSTVGNLAIQLATLSGQRTDRFGVDADAVAQWAARLSGSDAASGIGSRLDS